MAGIYIHIPFCRRKCNYCNFYSLATKQYHDEVFEAMKQELQQRKEFLAGEPIETLYFGGGTPSLFDSRKIAALIDEVDKYYNSSALSEITLEANPEDITKENLTDWENVGINRLSIGVQSFRQDDLNYLQRPHTVQQVDLAIVEALNHGFSNLSIDLIYGIPTLNNYGWEANLYQAFTYGIPHISAYSLTVESKTPLQHSIAKGKTTPVNENASIKQYNILTRLMLEQGYEHYEISNFCLPGSYSKHNTSYWQKKPYLGIGPSAHSYFKDVRSWNVSNLKMYIQSIHSGAVQCETESLSPTDQLNEYIMTSLRTGWGCNLKYIADTFGVNAYTMLQNEASLFLEEGKLIEKSGFWIVAPEWKLYTDGISSALFTVND